MAPILSKERRDKQLIFVPGHLVDEIRDASYKAGKPFNVFVEEVFHQVLGLLSLGYSLEQFTRLLEVAHTQRLSMTLIPLEVLSYLTGKADQAELQAKWFEAGEWYGKYLCEKFQNPVQALKRLLEATRWDLDEIDVEEEDLVARFRCVSAILSLEETESLLKFIEGAMGSLGYRTEKNDHVKGIILLHFRHSKPTNRKGDT